ncbi:MAG: ATPase domain-containing protein [Thermoplasmata archaeon]
MQRVKSGIPGFDVLTDGGFVEGTVNLVSGVAGSGKTLFSAQYAFFGARFLNEPSAVITIEAPKEDYLQAISGFGMNPEDTDKFWLIDLGEICGEEIQLDFPTLQQFIEDFLERQAIKRLVIDSITAIGLHYRTVEEFREHLFGFTRFLKKKRVTAVLTTESIENGPYTRFGVEQFVCDAFIVLGLEEIKGTLRRTILIRKMRFTKHDTAKHPFIIGDRGLEIGASEKVV